MLICAFVVMARGGQVIVDSHVYNNNNLVFNPNAEQNIFKFTKCTFANTTQSGIRINDQNSISTIEIALCYFYNCYEEFRGGGLYIFDSKRLDINNTCFDSCDVGNHKTDVIAQETRGPAAYTEGTHGDLNIFSNTAVAFHPNTPSGAQMDFHAKNYNMANNNFTNANAYYASGLEVRDPINVKINYLHFQNVTGSYGMSLSGDYNKNCQLSTAIQQITFIRCTINGEWGVVLFEYQATGLFAEDVYVFQMSAESNANYHIIGAAPYYDAYVTAKINNLVTDVTDDSHYTSTYFGGHCEINNIKICGIDYCFIPITAANLGKCQLATDAPFKPTQEFSHSKVLTPSIAFTASKSFTPSSRFTESHSFTPSYSFAPSNSFTSSFYFTASNSFTQSGQAATSYFTESSQFSSNFFSQSAVFSNKVNEGNHIKANDERRDRANMRAIIGGSVGGFIFLLLLILLILFIIYKTSQHAIEDSSDTNEDPNDKNNFDEFLLESEGEGTIDPTDKEEGIESYQNDPNTDDALTNSNTNDGNDIMSPEDGNDTIEDVYQQDDDQGNSIFIINTPLESHEIAPVVITAPLIVNEPKYLPKKKKKIRRKEKEEVINHGDENVIQEMTAHDNIEGSPKTDLKEGEEGIVPMILEAPLIATESADLPKKKKKIRRKKKAETMNPENKNNNDESTKLEKEIKTEEMTKEETNEGEVVPKKKRKRVKRTSKNIAASSQEDLVGIE